MPDKSISQLTAGVAVSDTDLLPNVQVVGVGPVKTTAAQIKSYVNTNPVVSGVIAAPAGSAAAPSFTFDGDLNTGWFRPAADTIAGSTGGTERIRLDSSGNVGVGVTPSAWSALKAIQLGTGAAFSGGAAFNDAFVSANIYYDGADWRRIATNGASYYSAGALGTHTWFVAANGSAGTAVSFTQAMTLSNAGNLGIGTTSPGYKLDVSGVVRVKSTTTGYILGPTGEMLIGEDVSSLYIGGGFGVAPAIPIAYGSPGTTLQRWFAGGDERMRLSSAGNLGIGTTGPNDRLVVENTTANVVSRISSGGSASYSASLALGTTARDWSISAAGAAASYIFSLNYIGTDAALSGILVATKTGNVGIGVTPSAWRTIYKAMDIGTRSAISDDDGPRIWGNAFENTSAATVYKTTGPATMYYAKAGVHQWFIAPSGTAGAAVSFTQAMTLDVSGNLGIAGQTAPSTPLTTGTWGNGLAVGTTTGTNGVVIVSSSTSTLSSLRFGDGVGGLYDQGFISYSHNSDSLSFGTARTDRMSIDANGNVVINSSAITTTATNGFLYVPGCAGTPTGVPTAYTGRVPIVVDTTNNKLYFYSGGAWRDAGP